MSKPFKRTEINGLSLANRFVRSATWEGLATDEGAVSARLTEPWSTWPKAGWG